MDKRKPSRKCSSMNEEERAEEAARSKRLKLAAAVERAVQESVREALIDHKRAGNPVAFWENGRVRWVPPEEIVIPDLPPKDETGDNDPPYPW